MNEQILELYKQAQEFAYKNISKEYWNTDNFHAVVSGKFAELIVKECLDACSRANDIKHFVPPTQEQVVLSCMREIETTFRS